MENRIETQDTSVFKNLRIERNTYEIFEKLCKRLGVNVYTMGNFMLIKSIMAFLETIEEDNILSKDEIIHIHGMGCSLDKMVINEMEFNAFKQFLDEMIENSKRE